MPFFKPKLTPEQRNRKKVQEDFIAEILKFETPITYETLEELNAIFREGLVKTVSARESAKLMKTEAELSGNEAQFSFRDTSDKSLQDTIRRGLELQQDRKIQTSLHLPEMQEVLHKLNHIIRAAPDKIAEIISQADQDYAEYATKYIPYLENPDMLNIKHQEFVHYRNKELHAFGDIGEKIRALNMEILDIHNKAVLKNVGRDAVI